MSSISSISLSGMQGAQAQLNAAANNLANVQTTGYHRRSVEQSAQAGGGVQAVTVAAASAQPTGGMTGTMTTDVVTELQAKNQFMANLAVFKSANAMTGSLLDVHG